MTLKERVRQGLTDEHKGLDIDTFGEIMDRFIRESACALLVHKEEGENEFHVQGVGCGAVTDFYILLNAIGPLYEKMLEEMGGRGEVDVAELAHALCGMLEKSLIGEEEE